VIGGFQCAKPGHAPDFRKTHPDTRVKKRTCLGKARRIVFFSLEAGLCLKYNVCHLVAGLFRDPLGELTALFQIL